MYNFPISNVNADYPGPIPGNPPVPYKYGAPVMYGSKIWLMYAINTFLRPAGVTVQTRASTRLSRRSAGRRDLHLTCLSALLHVLIV